MKTEIKDIIQNKICPETYGYVGKGCCPFEFINCKECIDDFKEVYYGNDEELKILYKIID